VFNVSRERILLQNSPAAEKARSASTDVGGMDSKYECTSCKLRPRTPLILNALMSLLIAVSLDLSFTKSASG